MSVEHAFQQGWSGVQRRAIYLELLEFGVTLQRTLLFFIFTKEEFLWVPLQIFLFPV